MIFIQVQRRGYDFVYQFTCQSFICCVSLEYYGLFTVWVTNSKGVSLSVSSIRHDMETLSALLAFCQGNSLVNRWILWQRVSYAELWYFLYFSLNKLLKKVNVSVIWDVMTLMWRHRCNVTVDHHMTSLFFISSCLLRWTVVKWPGRYFNQLKFWRWQSVCYHYLTCIFVFIAYICCF